MNPSAIQTTYYILGIIFMSLFFLGLLGIIGLIIAILAKVNHMHKQLNNLVKDIKEHPGEKAAEAIFGFASQLHEKSKK